MSTTYDSLGSTAASGTPRRPSVGRIPDPPREIPPGRESPVLLSLPDVSPKVAAVEVASTIAEPPASQTLDATARETGTTSAIARRQRAEQRKIRRQAEPVRGSIFQGSGRLILLTLLLGAVVILAMVSNRNRQGAPPIDDSAERWGKAAAKKPSDVPAKDDRGAPRDEASETNDTSTHPPSADDESGPTIAPPGAGADGSNRSGSVHAAAPRTKAGVRTADRRDTNFELQPPSSDADSESTQPVYPDTHAPPFHSRSDRNIRR